MYRKTPLASAVSFAIATGSLGFSPLVLSQEADNEAQEIEEVVVVGSRIRKNVFTHSAPIDVVLTEQAAVQGVGAIGDLLQTTTVAAGSAQVTAASSTAFVQNGGIGTQTLSLRGLGANRTLTLLNGRRIGPAGTRGAVSSFDLNILPLAAIERVEILKDGASSIYGSDAVAGVVNIITKKGDGGTIDAFVGMPQESGGEETRFSASWGQSFSRGNFRVTADYHKNDELTMGDRDFLSCPQMYIFDPDTGERADPIDPRTGQPRCADPNGGLWGHVWIYDYQADGNVPSGAKAQFDYDGDLGQYIPGFDDADPNDPDIMRVPPGWFPVNYDRPSDGVTQQNHPFRQGVSAYPESEKITFYGEGEFDFTDSLTAYTEVLLNRRETKVNGYRQYWGYVYNYDYFAGNPLSAGWTGAQWLSPTPITDHSDSKVEVDYQRFVAGLKGDIGQSSWTWDLAYQYSKSDGDYTDDVIYDDSISDQNWLSGSCEGLTTSVRGVPCIDIPWLDPAFLAGDVSPEMREFLFGSETGNTEYTQWSVEAFATGDLFELPAGTVAGAVGVHFREDEIVDTPGEITLASNAWGSSSAGITAGKDETRAVFGEVDVPILADMFLAESLTLNASARWTDVDSYGDDTTYKVGVNWQIVPSFRLRANQGTSFRTPALFELYLADQTSFLGQRFIDPCITWGDKLDAGEISQRVADNCAATIVPGLYDDGLPPDYTGGTITAEIITGGGLGVLEAERSKSRTIGLVWTPEFTDLSVAIDYFDIEVNDQVDQIGAGGIVGGCYNSEFWPTDPLCSLFDRTGVNAGIDNVRDSFINVATQTNKGWDLTLRWSTDVGPGTLTLDTQHTFQDEAITALFEDTVRDENGQFGEPEWVGRLWTTYDLQTWSFFWGARFVGKVENYEDFGGDTTTYRGETVRVVLDSDVVTYHDFSVTKEFDNGIRAVLGLRNAFDEEPPQITTLRLGTVNTEGTNPAANYSQYDWFGRSFYANLTWDFGQ
jgi:outer membrane receptor protein involved in Fe transport